MTLSVAVARSTGEDISQTLQNRAAEEENPVRSGILQLMADKRFLDTVSPVMIWQEDASEELEEFADSLERLEKEGQLNHESITQSIEDFFTFWAIQMKKKKPLYDSSRRARKKAGMGAIGRGGSADGPSGRGSCEKGHEKDIDNALSDYVEGQNDSEGDENGEGMGIGRGDPKMEQQRRENVFLKSIPESLKRLALLIGRAGENDISARGRFLTASKSDIEGITVGNNLSALLPSEVAMLSDKSTQDVFYRNYAGKRLQVFASASQSSGPDMHKDGPVIVCIDESSSMTGEPIRTAITLAYAVTIIAKRRHRPVLIVAYSDDHKIMRVESLERQKKQILEFLSNVSMGGNDENSMFEWLFKTILPQEDKFKTADILCVSDFGWVSIEAYVKNLIDEQKAAGMRFYGLNIGGIFGGWHDFNDDMWRGNSPMSICDSVWEYSKGVCVEVKGLSSSEAHRNKKRNPSSWMWPTRLWC